MEKSDLSSTSTSGVVTSTFESISNEFVSHTEMHSVGFNRLYKAQRYGKWYVLKGLSPEFANEPYLQRSLNLALNSTFRILHEQ